MTQKLYFIIAILCAIAGMTNTAQATTKTYIFAGEEGNTQTQFTGYFYAEDSPSTHYASTPSHGVTVTAYSARTDYVNHWQASMAIDGADGSSASGIAVVPPANDADGDVRAPSWYTLDGVRLNGKPTKKGLYIHGGRKVVIP